MLNREGALLVRISIGSAIGSTHTVPAITQEFSLSKFSQDPDIYVKMLLVASVLRNIDVCARNDSLLTGPAQILGFNMDPY